VGLSPDLLDFSLFYYWRKQEMHPIYRADCSNGGEAQSLPWIALKNTAKNPSEYIIHPIFFSPLLE